MTNLFALIVEAAVRGTFLMAAIGILAIALRNATAGMRHSILNFSIIAMLALPVITALAPPLRITAPRSFRGPHAELKPAPKEPRVLQSAPQNAAADVVLSHDEPVIEQPINNVPSRPSLIEALAFIWLGGVIVGFITLVGGLLVLRKMSRQAQPVSLQWDGALSQLKSELGIDRHVSVLVSSSTTMPATWGITRPVIVLPAAANEWDSERRRVVLMHELAHVKRNDCLSQVVAQVACAVYWFHPGVWYTARRLRAERELACDEAVVRSGVDKFDYATHLLTIATTFKSSGGSAVIGVAMARPSQLEGRLMAILAEDATRRWRPSMRTRVATLAALAVLTVPLAAMRPVTAADESLRASTESSREIGASLSFVPQSIAPDTFRWHGVVPTGEWIEVRSFEGNISAELSRSGEVEITAVKSGAGASDVKVAMDRARRGTSFCAVSVSVTERPCETNAAGELRNAVRNGRVDFVVKLPRGVGLAAHTDRGKHANRIDQCEVWSSSMETGSGVLH